MLRSSIILGAISLSLFGFFLTGCSQNSPSAKMSDTDKKNFQGGPMPPEARAEMMKRMQAANAPVSPAKK